MNFPSNFIIKLEQVLIGDDSYSILTEWCSGGTLLDYIKENKNEISEENIKRAMFNLLLGKVIN